MTRPVGVLFVCIGNSCRSPMAEGFARHLAPDRFEASSAGVFPASIVQPETCAVMAEVGIPIDPRYVPRRVEDLNVDNVDLLVNMTGGHVENLLPRFRGELVVWSIPDPIGRNLAFYRTVRDVIAEHVRALIGTAEERK